MLLVVWIYEWFTSDTPLTAKVNHEYSLVIMGCLVLVGICDGFAKGFEKDI